MTTHSVELRQLTKSFGGQPVVRSVDLTVRRGEFLSLLGPSGCGKTTILRMIAGFVEPTGGEILVEGRPTKGVPPYRRPVNTVFQNYSLFPHMTVEANVGFGLRMARVPASEIKSRVREALEMVGLDAYAGYYPGRLSGGQQQRVALARALVNRPRVLLLDEPLGALDLKLRKQMHIELKHIHRQLGTTFIFVTHDQEEAMVMSDRIGVMNAGRVEQVGTPAEIYAYPRTRFVADFIGESNLFNGRVLVPGKVVRIALPSGEALTGRYDGSELLASGQAATYCVRPERIRISSRQLDTDNHLEGTVTDVIFVGGALHVYVRTDQGIQVKSTIPHFEDGRLLSVGERIHVGWHEADGRILACNQS